MRDPARPAVSPLRDLTLRQRKVLRGIAEGKSNDCIAREIAASLTIVESEVTAARHTWMRRHDRVVAPPHRVTLALWYDAACASDERMRLLAAAVPA